MISVQNENRDREASQCEITNHKKKWKNFIHDEHYALMSNRSTLRVIMRKKEKDITKNQTQNSEKKWQKSYQ